VSYNCIYYHIIYATKSHRALLSEDQMARLCQYKSGIIRNMKSKLHIANGPGDHIHLAVSLDPGTSLIDFVRTVKTNSSRWIHETFPELSDFAWQDGYAAFTVSHSGLEKVVTYIRDQNVHHKKATYQEELDRFLERHGLEHGKSDVNG
jgi:putative transposase